MFFLSKTTEQLQAQIFIHLIKMDHITQIFIVHKEILDLQKDGCVITMLLHGMQMQEYLKTKLHITQ